MKEKIYTVAIPFFSLLCSCDAKERIELPKHEEGEQPGKCLARNSLFPDDLIPQIEVEFCADTEKNAADCRNRTGRRCNQSKESQQSEK